MRAESSSRTRSAAHPAQPWIHGQTRHWTRSSNSCVSSPSPPPKTKIPEQPRNSRGSVPDCSKPQTRTGRFLLRESGPSFFDGLGLYYSYRSRNGSRARLPCQSGLASANRGQASETETHEQGGARLRDDRQREGVTSCGDRAALEVQSENRELQVREG